MKREIKFRAWSKETEKMMDWKFIKSVSNLNKLLSLNHVDVMQFTGLLDKNGKEIYEGDICKAYQTLYETPSPLTVQIIYNAEFARFEPVQFWKSQNKWLSLSGEFKSNYDFEIIGNIYETPIEQATT